MGYFGQAWPQASDFHFTPDVRIQCDGFDSPDGFGMWRWKAYINGDEHSDDRWHGTHLDAIFGACRYLRILGLLPESEEYNYWDSAIPAYG